MTTAINPLDQLRVVLVETSHTGNMGSVARAMKTMGISQLYLVNPQVAPDSQAIALAAGASDIIQRAVIVNSLAQAIGDCRLVLATSARSRTLSWPLLTPSQAASQAIAVAEQAAPVALLFGRERVGLTNEEIQQSQYQIMIPTDEQYSSLNLAMAVQIICYEMRLAHLAVSTAGTNSTNVPTTALEDIQQYPLTAELAQFYQHLEQALIAGQFLRPQQPGQVMSKLRRLFNRAQPSSQELNILRGVLATLSPNTFAPSASKPTNELPK